MRSWSLVDTRAYPITSPVMVLSVPFTPREILSIDATPISRWFDMHPRSSSPAGVRFLASIKQGNSLSSSVRVSGIHKEVGYRWLRERYLQLRRAGSGPAEAMASLGSSTTRLPAWEAVVSGATDRHPLQVNVEVEASFWAAFENGKGPHQSALAAGVGRSTGYRWLQVRDLTSCAARRPL